MGLDRRIDHILKRIAQTPFKERVDPVELAQSVNVSLSRLRHLFKEETGISLGHFLLHREMEEAKNLFANSFLNVSEVMVEIGRPDADERNIIRLFKKMVGVTPGEFRRHWQARPHRLPPESLARKAA